MRQRSLCLQTTAEVAPPVVTSVARAEEVTKNKDQETKKQKENPTKILEIAVQGHVLKCLQIVA